MILVALLLVLALTGPVAYAAAVVADLLLCRRALARAERIREDLEIDEWLARIKLPAITVDPGPPRGVCPAYTPNDATGRYVRVIKDRALGEAEHDAEWEDDDGYRWRYIHNEWLCGLPDGWSPCDPRGAYAPYTEIPKTSSTESAAGLPLAPSVEDSPAVARPAATAGHPNLTHDELRDAALAVRRMAASKTEAPRAFDAWMRLVEKLETAALAS